MALDSPGVQISVSDESFYAPAGAGTVERGVYRAGSQHGRSDHAVPLRGNQAGHENWPFVRQVRSVGAFLDRILDDEVSYDDGPRRC